MNAGGRREFHLKVRRVVSLALACVLAFAGQGTAQSASAAQPWGDAEVRAVVQNHNCTVYGLVSDPEHVFWVVCTPPSATTSPAADTGH